MGSRVIVSMLCAAILAAGTPALALADGAQAPPALSPALADSIASACPGSRSYADALVRGITADEIAAAQPKFSACSRQVRLVEYQWKNDAADLALGALAIARAQLNHDPQALRLAIAAAEKTRIALRRDRFGYADPWATVNSRYAMYGDQVPGRRTDPAIEPSLNSPVIPAP